jgi:hypothetical protein
LDEPLLLDQAALTLQSTRKSRLRSLCIFSRVASFAVEARQTGKPAVYCNYNASSETDGPFLEVAARQLRETRRFHE